MTYLVERDLFMTKLEGYIVDKAAQGYRVENVFVSQYDEKDGNYRASKVTVIMCKED